MEITICIGSSCHLKGAKTVVSILENLIEQHDVKNDIYLKGSFCMGKCSSEGVSMKVDDDFFYMTPEATEQFFQDEILRRLNK